MANRNNEVTMPLYPTFEPVGSDPRKFRAGFITKNGLRAVEPTFEHARPFRCGLAPVRQHKRWGAIDGQGRLRIRPVSDLPLGISEDRAIYEVKGLRGVMDLAGQIILEPKYRTIGEYQEGVAWMSSGDLYGFLSSAGEELISPRYEDVRSFSEGLAPVKIGKKWGFVNKSFELEIPLQFDFALPFSESLARVKQGDLWGYIDRTGKYAIAPQYERAREFREGLADISVGGRWGYINQRGDVAIATKYRYSGEFTEGLAYVEPFDNPERHVGFIDREGAYVIPPQFLMVATFRYGLCLVELTEELAYIDRNGTIIWHGPFVDVGRISQL